MKICNKDIREEAKEANVKLWQIAEKLRMHEVTLSRKLRHELPAEEKAKIRAIISALKEEE